jgi:hypothetical protein
VWLAATGLAFHEGAMVLGDALGGVLTAVAVLVAVTHFCIPSLVYNTLFPRPATQRLRTFQVLSETLHFRHAAERLGLTRPSSGKTGSSPSGR